MFNKFFRKSRRFLDNVERIGTTGRPTDNDMMPHRKDICVPDDQGKNTDKLITLVPATS